MRIFSRYNFIALLAVTAFCGFRLARTAEEIYVVVLFNRNVVVGASSMRSGLFYSSDNGDSWEHTGWNNVRAFGAAIDANFNGDRMWIAAGNGIHRTTDGGKFWKIVTDWHITEAMRVAIDPANDSTIYTATAYGIFKSTDNGNSWVEKNNGLRSTYTSSLLVDRKNPQHLLTGTEEAPYISDDGGEHWRRYASDSTMNKAVLDIEQSVSEPDVLMLTTEKDGIWRSTDDGNYWAKTANGLPNAPWYSVAIDPMNASTAYAAGFKTGVWKTTDDGAHWTDVSGELAKKSFHALAVSKEHPNEVFAGEYDGGVWRSQDGGATWKFIGLDGSQVWQILVQ
jgi:photosystem II stability/assembly factor-like uncharacterized protein